jgi:hypothetical protein
VKLRVAYSDNFRYAFLFSDFTGKIGWILSEEYDSEDKYGQTADMAIGTDSVFHNFTGCVCGGKSGIGRPGNTDRRCSFRQFTGKIGEQTGAECRNFRTPEYSEA